MKGKHYFMGENMGGNWTNHEKERKIITIKNRERYGFKIKDKLNQMYWIMDIKECIFH